MILLKWSNVLRMVLKSILRTGYVILEIASKFDIMKDVVYCCATTECVFLWCKASPCLLTNASYCCSLSRRKPRVKTLFYGLNNAIMCCFKYMHSNSCHDCVILRMKGLPCIMQCWTITLSLWSSWLNKNVI